MPPKEVHLKQSNHNEEFYYLISPNQFTDWAVVVLFYSALHIVDAFLAIHGIHPGSHERRVKLVNTMHDLKPIADEFMILKDESELARYNAKKFSETEVSMLENTYKLIKANMLLLLG